MDGVKITEAGVLTPNIISVWMSLLQRIGRIELNRSPPPESILDTVADSRIPPKDTQNNLRCARTLAPSGSSAGF